MTSLRNWVLKVWQAVKPQAETTAWEQYKKARFLSEQTAAEGQSQSAS